MSASPSRARKRWTVADQGALCEALSRCVSIKGVAASIGRSEKAVRLRMSETGLTMSGANGLHTQNTVCKSLGWSAGNTVFTRWRSLGLKHTLGPKRGSHRERMYSADDILAFMRERPECFNPNAYAPGVMKRRMGAWFASEFQRALKEISALRFKRLQCDRSDLHASGAPEFTWAPMFASTSHCEVCRKRISDFAWGPVSERYSDTDPGRNLALSVWEARVLAAIPPGGAIGLSAAALAAYGNDSKLMKRRILAIVAANAGRMGVAVERLPRGGARKGAERVRFRRSEQ